MHATLFLSTTMLSHTDFIHDKTVFTLLGSLPEPTFLIAPDGTLLYANEAFVSKLDPESRHVLKSNVFDHHASIPEIATGLWEQVDRVLSSCRRQEFEEEHDGRRYHYLITPECSGCGDITRLYIIVRERLDEARKRQPDRPREGRPKIHLLW